MKPKEWLLANGYIKEITRGRMSRENIARIEQAVRDGVQIEGYNVSSVQPAENAPVKVERVAANTARVFDMPDEARDENSWSAHTSEGQIGMRTVGQCCGNSLNYCRCATPMVWLDHNRQGAVHFKPAKSSTRKW